MTNSNAPQSTFDSDTESKEDVASASRTQRRGFLYALRVWGRFLRMRLRWWITGHVIASIVVAVVFLGSLWVIAREVRGYEYAKVASYLEVLPTSHVLLAIGLTLLTFVVLTGYDMLALRYVDVDLASRRVMFSAFIGYAVSQAIGNPILTGGSVRYRLYSVWGISPAKVAKSILFAGVSFWLGFFTLGGLVLLVEPPSLAAVLDLPIRSAGLGLLILLPVGAYAGFTWYRTTPVEVRGWTLNTPPNWMLPVQIALAAADLGLASSVLYVLLPSDVSVSLPFLLVSYLIALLAGLLSHVPGGLGVFESILLLILTPEVPAPALLSGLLAYRGIFHLLPLVLAAAAFGAYELRRAMREWSQWGFGPYTDN